MAHTEATGLIATSGIELLTYGTPNGFKVAILLEEIKEAYGYDYTVQTIDIFRGDQKQDWYTALNPNGKIPTVVNHDEGGFVVFEGLAILNYLTKLYDAEARFHFDNALEACEAEQWLAWQHGGLGPMQAQANFYYRFCPTRHPFPTFRYISETERLYSVLEARLVNREYVAGSGKGRYSIVDMAIWPFVDACAVCGLELEKWSNVFEWWKRVGERPAVKRGMCVPGGETFRFGYARVQEEWERDPKGVEEREAPLKKVLDMARGEFGRAV